MPDLIKHYRMITPFYPVANGTWGFAVNELTNEEVFIKEFSRYRYPSADANPEEEWVKKSIESCDQYKNRMIEINTSVRNVAGQSGDVVVTIDFFCHDSKLYKVNKKIDFKDWKASDVHQRMSVEEINRMMKGLVNAISALHNAQIIHCDLKPDNIFIIENNNAYVGMISDFDDSFFKSHIPDSNNIVGTPEYCSPEIGLYIAQEGVQGDPITQHIGQTSDIFALGLIYHEYLTGGLPAFPEEDGQLWVTKLQRPDKVRLSNKLGYMHRKLIRGMLETDPQNRIQTCAQIAHEIGLIERYANNRIAITITRAGAPLAKQRTQIDIKDEATNRFKPALAATTNEQGKILLTGMPPGSYRLVITGEPPKVFSFRNTNILSVQYDLSSGSIEVHVLEDGADLSNCSVALYQSQNDAVRLFKESITTPSGRLRFENIPAGNYIVKAGDVEKKVTVQLNKQESLQFSLESKKKIVLKLVDKITRAPVGGVEILLCENEKTAAGYRCLHKEATNSFGVAELGMHAAGVYRICLRGLPKQYRQVRFFTVNVNKEQKEQTFSYSLSLDVSKQYKVQVFDPPLGAVKSVQKINEILAVITLTNGRQNLVKIKELSLFGIKLKEEDQEG